VRLLAVAFAIVACAAVARAETGGTKDDPAAEEIDRLQHEFSQRSPAETVAQLDALVARFPGTVPAQRALLWAGQLLAARDDLDGAARRYRAVLDGAPPR
jgi:hypothetical protein